MDTEKTTETDTSTEQTGGEGTEETISVSKKDYDTLNQTLGAYKKQLKDFKKAQEEAEKPKETPQTKPDDALLQRLERMALRQAGLTHSDDIDLARATAKKWGMELDEVLLDDDFKTKLERQQSNRANVEATSNIKGSGNPTSGKQTPEYWIQKGTPPSASDVPDNKTRRKIAREFLKAGTGGGKTFYNE